MSRTYSKLSNKHTNYLSEYSNQYLYNAGEPYENLSSSPLAKLEIELSDNYESMRIGFRNRARILRRR